MKRGKNIIKRALMGKLHFITNLLGNERLEHHYLDAGTRKEIITRLNYPASKLLYCTGQVIKFDLPKESKITFLECLASLEILFLV